MPKLRFPHPLVLIFAMIVVAQILTYVLPAGSFEREPMPGAGETYVTAEGERPLRERIADARAARGVTEPALAKMFGVSEQTVREWELGPPGPEEEWRPGTHIEENVGRLLDEWVESGEPPDAEELASWRSAMAGVKQRVVPGTYAALTDTGSTPWFTFIKAPLRGMMAAGEVIFFVFIVGGVIAVLRATGAIDALIGAAIGGFGRRPVVLVAGMTTLFAIGSWMIGMAEEYMPFIPLLVTMCLALRTDAMVAVGIVYVGAGIGYGTAGFNPFTVIIAQGIAGVEPTSGWAFRALFLVACLAVGVHHLMRYANRVARDPSRSLVGDIDYSKGFELPHDVELTTRRALVLVTFVLGIALFVFGIAWWGWYFEELSMVFLGMALLAAILGGVTPNRTASEFCQGAAEMTTTALLIGFARTIEVVLTDGQVIDTVIHGIASVLEGTSAFVSATGMLVVQSVCNLFIPSGSGQAYVTMPIMAPLADLTAVSRQTSVLAYQIGDGFTNMIVPTNALLMGMLALGKIPYQRWLRFVLPLMVKLYVVALAALGIAVAIGF